MAGIRPPGTPASRRAVAFVLSTSVVAYSMLQSAVVPALASIRRELDASATGTAWLFTAFLLSSSVATPIIGRLGDLFGRSRMLVLCLGALAVGSAIAGATSSLELMIAARVLQGLAGAVLPLAFGIVTDTFPPTRVPSMIGRISAVLAVGSASGIVISGPIVEHLGYRWLFWLPLLAIVPTAAAAAWLMPSSPRREVGRVDWTGAVLLAAWLVALLLAISQGPGWGWTSPGTVGLLLVAVVVAVVWWAVELGSEPPLIDVRLMMEPVPRWTSLVGFTTGWAMQAAFAWVPQFVQVPPASGYGLGVGEDVAGLYILPWSLGSLVAGVAAGRLAARHGSRASLVGGSVLSAVAFTQLALVHGERWHVLAAMLVLGLGLGIVTAAMPTLLVAAVPRHQTGATTGMNANLRTIGGAVGAQVVAVIITSGTDGGDPREGSYTASFLVLAAVCVVATFAALAVPRPGPPGS